MKLRQDLRRSGVGSASRNSRVSWDGLRAPGNKPCGLCARVLGDACSRHVCETGVRVRQKRLV